VEGKKDGAQTRADFLRPVLYINSAARTVRRCLQQEARRRAALISTGEQT
jgi:hypothetical protein